VFILWRGKSKGKFITFTNLCALQTYNWLRPNAATTKKFTNTYKVPAINTETMRYISWSQTFQLVFVVELPWFQQTRNYTFSHNKQCLRNQEERHWYYGCNVSYVYKCWQTHCFLAEIWTREANMQRCPLTQTSHVQPAAQSKVSWGPIRFSLQ